MTIKIITGSIWGDDTYGEMLKLYRKGIFYQWYYTKKGWGKKKTKFITDLEKSRLFKIIQTTGSGKTILGNIWLYQAHKKGIKTAANMNISFIDKNINSFEDLTALYGYEILLDDIKHIIPTWQSTAAKLAAEFSNSSRKKKDEILITSQRIINYIPPDIREIADEFHVPYIRCFDATIKAPDWTPSNKKYKPLELYDFRFSSGMEFLDYKVFDLTGRTGNFVLDSFKTLQISDSFNS